MSGFQLSWKDRGMLISIAREWGDELRGICDLRSTYATRLSAGVTQLLRQGDSQVARSTAVGRGLDTVLVTGQ